MKIHNLNFLISESNNNIPTLIIAMSQEEIAIATQRDIHRTLRVVCAPLKGLRMVLAQWVQVPDAVKYQITAEATTARVIADLERILTAASVKLEDLHELELLHIKLHCDDFKWNKFTYTGKELKITSIIWNLITQHRLLF